MLTHQTSGFSISTMSSLSLTHREVSSEKINGCHTSRDTYLPTVPHSAGLSRKKHHCPAVPHGGLIVPHFKCACVRRPEPPHMASPTPPWLIHLRTLVSVVRLGINLHFVNEGLVSVRVIESAKTATSRSFKTQAQTS